MAEGDSTETLSGLTTKYFNLEADPKGLDNVDFTAEPFTTGTLQDLQLRTKKAFGEGGNPNLHAAEMIGKFQVDEAGSYEFALKLNGAARIYIDDELAFDFLHPRSTKGYTASLDLTEGLHDIKVEYYDTTGVSVLDLVWSGPNFSNQPLKFDGSYPDADPVTVDDVPGEAQTLEGTTAEDDTFVIAGDSTYYNWTTDADTGAVTVWKDDAIRDQLTNFEYIQFDDKTVNLADVPEQTAAVMIADDPDTSQIVIGGESTQDKFVVDGDSNDYNWMSLPDGKVVIWTSENNDVLENVELIEFSNRTVTIADETVHLAGSETPVSVEVTDDPDAAETVDGGEADADTFIIDGDSTDYNWTTAADANVVSVWMDEAKRDTLKDFEFIKFNDKTITLAETPEQILPPKPITITDDPETNQLVQGGESDQDTFIVASDSVDYNWMQIADGRTVVWKDGKVDVLFGIEKVEFADRTVTLADEPQHKAGDPAPAGPVTITDDPAVSQSVEGNDSDSDTFVIDGNYADYNWTKLPIEGDRYVVWLDRTGFDHLKDVEYIKFNDHTVKLSDHPVHRAGQLIEEFDPIVPVTITDDAAAAELISGNNSTEDTFVIDGNAVDYTWQKLPLPGEHYAIWIDRANVDRLINVEYVQFNDMKIKLADMPRHLGGVPIEGGDAPENNEPEGEQIPAAVSISDDPETGQTLVGGDATGDTFVIDGNAADYTWQKLPFGEDRYAVWVDRDKVDSLQKFEYIQFNDYKIELAEMPRHIAGGAISADDTGVSEILDGKDPVVVDGVGPIEAPSGVTINDNPDANQIVAGGEEKGDTFVIDGNAADYTWQKLPFAEGRYAVWMDRAKVDGLKDIEYIQFNDYKIELAQMSNHTAGTAISADDDGVSEVLDGKDPVVVDGVGPIEAPSGITITDDPNASQSVTGGESVDDKFVISGDSSDYNWLKLPSGAFAVWEQGQPYGDQLRNIEKLEFADRTVDLASEPSHRVSTSEDTASASEKEDDIYVVDGKSEDYVWGTTNDGTHFVALKAVGDGGIEASLLPDYEQIQFDDVLIDLA